MSLSAVLPLGGLLYLLVIFVVLYLLVRPIIHGAIYFPTKSDSVRTIVGLADVKVGEKIADIGSGDGRVVIAFAEKGIEAHGYEINPLLVWSSRRAIRKAHLEGLAFVHWEDFWKISLAGFQAIVVYGMPRFLDDFEKKMEQEADPGTTVISNIYPLPHQKPFAIKDRIYVYRVGEKIK